MISWSKVWELVKVNILYSNPYAVAGIQKKQAKKPYKQFSAYKSMLKQQAFSLLMMFVVYSVLFLGVDYTKAPAYLSLQVAVFSVLSLLYFFLSLFAVFYDSKDTKLYLPLPVKSEEIYLAKLFSSQGMGVAFLTPVLSYLTIAYWQTNHSLLAPLVALVMFALIIVTNNAIGLVLLFFMGKALAKSRYKKLVSGIIMFMGIAVGGALYAILQTTSRLAMEKGQDFFNIPYFRGFYDVYVNPFSQASLLHFWTGIILVIGLGFFIRYKILPHYIADSLKMDAKVVTKRHKVKTDASLNQSLIRHHMSGLKDTTLLMQNVSQTILFGIMFLAPLLSGELDGFGKHVTLGHFGIVLLVGLFIGSMLSTPTSFLGVGLSLERENYQFIKTLPINFKTFVRHKFLTLAALQLVLPLPIYTLLALFLGFNPLLVLILLVGIAISTLVIGEWVYARDYKLLMLNWQNINQLFYRGGGQWLLAGLQIGILILGMALIVLSAILSFVVSPILISLGLLLLVSAILAAIHFLIGKPFWKKLS